jgi:hypothetical protein
MELFLCSKGLKSSSEFEKWSTISGSKVGCISSMQKIKSI